MLTSCFDYLHQLLSCPSLALSLSLITINMTNCTDLAWVADVLSDLFHIRAGDTSHVRHRDHKLEVSERYLLFTTTPCTACTKLSSPIRFILDCLRCCVEV